ncbi:hypothetical protein CDC53_06835 [Salmonella enterica subsp. enterica serovar Enteritidis]|nr:hypothetical protein CDC53_06835 [Salmonella enterica subsp. enterica serovar Enteritidis]
MSCAIVRGLNSKAATANPEAGINAINSDAFCVYSGDNARVKAFKLSAEFCHLRRRYARQARCRLTISAGSA